MREKIYSAVGLLLITSGVLVDRSLSTKILGFGIVEIGTNSTFVLALSLSMVFVGCITILLRRRKIISKIYLSIFCSTLLLLFFEWYLSIFNPQVFEDNHAQLFRYDQNLGWAYIRSGAARLDSAGEYQVDIKINSQGQRDKEYSVVKPADTQRIIVLGDSFTSSLDVEDDEIYTEILEKNLPKTEVINFGVNGYGPLQEFIQLRETGIRYAPDVVIMTVYVGNDFDDNTGEYDWIAGYQRPIAHLDEHDNLLITNIPVPQPVPKARRNVLISVPRLHLLQLIKNVFGYKNLLLPPELQLIHTPITSYHTKRFLLMEKIIQDMANYCKSQNIRFIIVIAPTISQVNQKMWEQTQKSLSLKTENYDQNLPNNILVQIGKKNNIEFVDLTGILKGATAFGQTLYYPYTRHWNKFGHQKVAEVLTQYLTK